MCAIRLCLVCVFLSALVTVTHSATAASPSVAKGGMKLSALWRGAAKKALPAAAAAWLAFTPPPAPALPSSPVPKLPSVQHALPTEHPQLPGGYLGHRVFFTQEGIGTRGIVIASDGRTATVAVPSPTGGNEHITVSVADIEAVLSQDYAVVGNLVTFVPSDRVHDLELAALTFPTGVSVFPDGRLVFDGEQEKEVAFGLITATTEDGSYIVRPYLHNMFAPDPHKGDIEPFAHRNHSHEVKHFHRLNKGLYLVTRENIFTGLGRVVLEETEINTPFFSPLAGYDRQREANAAAQRGGLPLPHENVPAPVISPYLTEKHTAADFVDRIIYYYEADGSKYVAYAVGQRKGKVAVLLPGGKQKKLVAVEQIRAASRESEVVGNGVSFITGSAYPLIHSVHWQGERLPGSRGVVWGGRVVDGTVVASLDNDLVIVKVEINSGNGLYINYQLYLIHNRSEGLLHYGNHHHHDGGNNW